ncbi:MAG: hypothetical protein HFH40_06520 [Lachnospiraceae bacterium]|nr:hypothetical protein [Lachnospiraceae bacterium]
MKKIRWYLECFVTYFKINVLVVMEYKLDFLAINLASILALLVGVFNIEIIFSHVEAMKAWNKDEVLWCLGFFYMVRAIYNTFFINTLSISYWVQNGKFDLYMIRPLNTFFQLLSSGRYNAEYPLDEYLVGGILLVKTGLSLHLFQDGTDWLLFAYLLLTGVFVYFSILFIFSSLSFWMVKSNMFLVMIENLERLAEYPIDIYHKAIRVAVSMLIPIALVNYYPTVFLLRGRDVRVLLFITGVCVVLGVIAVAVWKLGMKAYQSTGA